MAKREPKQPAPCQHLVAQWKTVGAEHQMRCVRCQHILEREFGVRQRKIGVMLFKDYDGGATYAPFDPKAGF
jgi:hypothetical protein